MASFVFQIDIGAGILCVVLATMIIAHFLLTNFRVRRGYFGCNPEEALELINYIIEKTNKDGHPPGSALSRSYAQQVEAESFSPEAIPGARI